jgi:hypothetical protein
VSANYWLRNGPGITSRFARDMLSRPLLGVQHRRCSECSIKEGRMDAYAPEIERVMKRLYDSLGEKDRRRYAAVEATKLGHGGIEYVSRLLGCDPKTIRQGQSELEGTDDLDSSRVRKKGAGGNG